MLKKKTLAIFLIVLGLIFILYFLDTLTSAEPSNLLAWIALALGAGANLKGWSDLLKKEKPAAPNKDQRVQVMEDSDFGEQSMKGRGGTQKQTMKNSQNGKQNME